MKERAIIYLVIITGITFFIVGFQLFTAEDRLESLSAIHIANIIEEKEAERYVLDRVIMKKPEEPNYPDDIDIEKGGDFTIEGCTFSIKPNKPELKCGRCGGSTTNKWWFDVHNCISTTEENSQGKRVPELRGAFSKNWPGRKENHYGTKGKYWDDENKLWIYDDPNEASYKAFFGWE